MTDAVKHTHTHTQRAVTHYDQVEQDLYNRAKGAEAERKRRDQVLGKMEEDLNYLKRENARRLKVGVVNLEVGVACFISRCGLF